MVSIGGLNLTIPTGVIGNILLWGFWGIIIITVVGLIGWYIYAKVRKKVTYIDKITLTKIFDNGSEETFYGLNGGKYVGRLGAWDYKIKIPKVRKPKELGYLPDFSKADKDGTIHFTVYGDGTFWQQTEWKTAIRELKQIKNADGTFQEYEVELLKKPIIGSDEKNIMIKDIKNWREVVAKNKVTAFAIGLGMFIIMVVAHLISLYIQTKIKCPGVP